MSQTEEMTQAKPKRKWRITRRGFLMGLGITGAGLAVGITVGRRPFWRFMASSLESGGPPGGGDTNPFAWFEITPANDIMMYSSKVEMGQGVHTALAQIGCSCLSIIAG